MNILRLVGASDVMLIGQMIMKKSKGIIGEVLHTILANVGIVLIKSFMTIIMMALPTE